MEEENRRDISLAKEWQYRRILITLIFELILLALKRGVAD
jgi:hypothetical protein